MSTPVAGGAGAGMMGGISPAAWLMAGSSVLGAALSTAPAGPSSAASQNITDQIFDNSGFTVAMSGATATAEASKGFSINPWLVLGVTALLVVGWVRSKR